jgi:hypothetical protein
MSYAWDRKAADRRIAAQIVEILNGGSPAEMPYFQETHWELVINLKVAKELGLTAKGLRWGAVASAVQRSESLPSFIGSRAETFVDRIQEIDSFMSEPMSCTGLFSPDFFSCLDHGVERIASSHCLRGRVDAQVGLETLAIVTTRMLKRPLHVDGRVEFLFNR